MTDRFIDTRNPSRGYDSWKATDRAGDELLSQYPSEKLRRPNVKLPKPPCGKSMLCSQRAHHLGACDQLEPLELVVTKGLPR